MTLVAVGEEQAAAKRLLMLEAGAAWFEYLERTRDLSEVRYEEVELWAWRRLQARLRELHARFEGRFG